MKIKLDENMPADLAEELCRLGHDADTAPQEGLAGHPDSEIREKAAADSRFLITQDLDFSDVRHHGAGAHAGIMVLRIQPASRRELISRVLEIFRTEPAASWSGKLVIVTANKMRIRPI